MYNAHYSQANGTFVFYINVKSFDILAYKYDSLATRYSNVKCIPLSISLEYARRWSGNSVENHLIELFH